MALYLKVEIASAVQLFCLISEAANSTALATLPISAEAGRIVQPDPQVAIDEQLLA